MGKVEAHHAEQTEYFARADHPTIQPNSAPYTQRHLTELMRASGMRPGDRVLEVGAGLGRFARLMADLEVRVVASDISAQLLAALHAERPDIETVVSGVEALPDRANGVFDQVVAFFALHHFENLAVAFAAMVRLLRPGGRVAFCEPNGFFLPFYAQILLSPRMRWAVDKGVLNMRPSVLFPAMRAAGLHDLSVHRYGFFPPQVVNRAPGQALERWCERLVPNGRLRAFQIVTGVHAP